jgi:hypothetical protein
MEMLNILGVYSNLTMVAMVKTNKTNMLCTNSALEGATPGDG